MGVFRFKKFSVCDDQAAMKLGTDGVLLAAWADVSNAKKILDIGTGCGVIALILAQRSDEDARIECVDSSLQDANQASENFLKSPWPFKMTVYHTRIQDFKPAASFDLIVCNPPYFSKSLLPQVEQRSKARHTITLTPEELLEATVRLLSPQGKFSCILPVPEGEAFLEKARSINFFPYRIVHFFTRRGKPPERLLIEFGLTNETSIAESLVLYESGDQKTKAYTDLTGEFYLDRS